MPPEPWPPRLRRARAADADGIAALHARSWRTAYRGMMSEAYLDGPVEAERRAFWTARMDHPPAGLWTLLAETPRGVLAGFVCALVDHDQRWGTLIDNLHADPAHRGQGLGRLLLRRLGAALVEAGSSRPVHLFVLCANTAAGGFYAHLGGQVVETEAHTEPDGSSLPANRVAWPDVGAFAAAVG